MTSVHTVALMLLAALSNASGAVLAAPLSASAQTGPFDFGYIVTGAAAARPVQVFDDGQSKTYFQFPRGVRLPVILIGQGPAMAAATVEGPYLTVSGRAWEYTFLLDGAKARVRHRGLAAGGNVQDAVGEPGVAATPPPSYQVADRRSSSYATPVRGDVIEWIEPPETVKHLAQFIGHRSHLSPATRELITSTSQRWTANVQVHIVVRNEGSPRAPTTRSRLAALRQSLVDAGIAPDRISQSDAQEGSHSRRGGAEFWLIWKGSPRPAPTAPPPGPPSAKASPVYGRPLARNFDILVSDKTLAASMGRWAKQSGHRFVWDTPIQAPVTGETTVDAHAFPDAAAAVVRGLQVSGYPVQLLREGPDSYRVSHAVQAQ